MQGSFPLGEVSGSQVPRDLAAPSALDRGVEAIGAAAPPSAPLPPRLAPPAHGVVRCGACLLPPASVTWHGDGFGDMVPEYFRGRSINTRISLTYPVHLPKPGTLTWAQRCLLQSSSGFPRGPPSCPSQCFPPPGQDPFKQMCFHCLRLS